MRHIWVSMSVMLFCLLFLSSIASAVWNIDGNAICTASGDQQYPAVISDGVGGAIMVWHDKRAGQWDIYAQRVDGVGNNLWATNGVAICTASGNQEYPGICCDGAGGAIITWYDYRGSDRDIYAQRVDASGNVLWTLNGVGMCTATGHQGYPPHIYYKGYRIIVPDGSGGAIISWHDARAASWDIYAQRVDALGNSLWTANGVAVCTASGHQWRPVLIGDGSGGAIITWNIDCHCCSGADVYAQKIDASGTPRWTTNGVAICTAPNYQCYPDIVSDGAGGAIIAWIDGRVGGYYEDNIYAQRINSSGTVMWTPNGVGIGTAPGDDGFPQLLPDGLGGAFIAWGDGRSAPGDVYMQRVDASGNIYWAVNGIALAPMTTHSQGDHGIASDGAGGAIVTWIHRNVQQIFYDVHGQRINGSGVVQWGTGGVTICAAVNNQYVIRSESVVSDGSGGANIAWWDYRSGSNNDIYALRIDQYGEIFTPGFTLDIKPRSCPNPFNITWLENSDKERGNDYALHRKDGVLPAALVGSEGLDVTDIDLSTLSLEGFAPLRTSFEDITRPVTESGTCACTTEGPDGILDLTLKFSRREIAGVLGEVEHGDVVELTITGALIDGTLFEASDCITILSKHPEPKMDTQSDEVELGPAIPNPFNPTTIIGYYLPETSPVILDIYDISGRRVTRLVDKVLDKGFHTAEWNGTGNQGNSVASGVYFYRLIAGKEMISKKMVLLK